MGLRRGRLLQMGGNRGDFPGMNSRRTRACTIVRNAFVNCRGNHRAVIPPPPRSGRGSATRRNGAQVSSTALTTQGRMPDAAGPHSRRPIYFASEPAQNLQDCSTGCTNLIPGISGRLVYYALDHLEFVG